MPRQTEPLTPRQRQSQQIVRDKKAKKRRDEIRRRLQFAGGALLGVLAMGIGTYSWYSGALAATTQKIGDRFYGATAQAGFAVRSLHVEGRGRTPMAEITQALGVKKNDPILRLSLEEIRERLQAIHTVREAAVERALPDALYVRIVEREPVALWQHQGAMSLVDDQGVVMQGIDITPYRNLPLIVGDGAPEHVQELMKILATAPELAGQFASAIRVGDRRWNIRLTGDIEVKLPEDNAQDALAHLAALAKEESLLERAVRVIDLRMPDRVFIKLSPELLNQPSTAGAKET